MYSVKLIICIISKKLLFIFSSQLKLNYNYHTAILLTLINIFQSEIKETLEAICSLLPITSYKDDCYIIVERYLSKIIENSVNAVSPKQFCTTLKICPAKSVKVKSNYL